MKKKWSLIITFLSITLIAVAFNLLISPIAVASAGAPIVTKEGSSDVKPTVITGNTSNLTDRSVTLNGKITSNDWPSILYYGITWGISFTKLTNQVNGTGENYQEGNFYVNLSGLTPNTTYYYVAWAVNEAGEGYGTVNSFTTGSNSKTLADPLVWTSHNSGSSKALCKIIYANNRFVAIGLGGIILTSPDAKTWTIQNSGTSTELNNIIYADNTFVVVGWGVILTSPDAKTWTIQNPGSPEIAWNNLYDITYANNTFIVVGVSGTILTSLDAKNWTKQNSQTTEDLGSVIYANNTFVVAGKGGTILTSPDAKIWTKQSCGASETLKDLIYANNIFVAIGNFIYTSPNAKTWTKQNSKAEDFWSIIYDNNTFVAVGNAIFTSTDGTNWTNQCQFSRFSAFNVSSVTSGRNTFVAVGFRGIITSPDAKVWTSHDMPNRHSPGLVGIPLSTVTYGNNTFVAVGDYGIILTSKDPSTDSQFKAEYYNNNNFSGAPVYTENVNSIDYDWGSGGPGNGVKNDDFSVRWSRRVYLDSANYIFTTKADDEIQVNVDGKPIYISFPIIQQTTVLNLESGYHDIEVKYFEKTGTASAKFSYQQATNKTDFDGDGYTDDIDRFPTEPYITPVILIHGRGDNCEKCFGAVTNGSQLYNSKDDLDSPGYKIGVFTTPIYQEILDVTTNTQIDPNIKLLSAPENLAVRLTKDKYTINKTLFAFNYPNWDLVSRNADLLDKYINNLIKEKKDTITWKEKQNGGPVYNDKSLYSLFPYRNSLEPCKFDLIGHSMGGLVSRYYIENGPGQEYVRKLITIDTPHWGSSLAYWSWGTQVAGNEYLLCDNDLREDSRLFGGNNKDNNTETAFKLNHGKVKYYAIDGWDVPLDLVSKWKNAPQNVLVDISGITTQDITRELRNAIKEKNGPSESYAVGLWFINSGIEQQGDCVVSNLSQIGCGALTRVNNFLEADNFKADEKRTIIMDKISINLDLITGHDLLKKLLLHWENQHRTEIIDKVMEYLK